MGLSANSGFFKNTNGEKKYHKMDLQLFSEFPKNKAQIDHIMRDAEGHLTDSIENRSLLISISSDRKNYLGIDKHGVEWYAKTIDGRQIWVAVKNDVIQNGGINNEPLNFTPNSGLKKKIVIRRK